MSSLVLSNEDADDEVTRLRTRRPAGFQTNPPRSEQIAPASHTSDSSEPPGPLHEHPFRGEA